MKIKIEGISPYDGEYPLDMGRLTNRDIHTIKIITGSMPLEYEEMGAKGDTDFVVAMAIIAIRKSGQHQRINEDAIWDAEIGKITIDVEDEVGEEQDRPPLIAPETPTPPSGAPSPIDGGTPAGEEPSLYWNGFLGYVGLRPLDLAELTPYQMDEAFAVAKAALGVET